MKKIIALILAAALLASGALAFSSCAKTVPVVGILQYGEHSSLDNCREGFLAGLADAGLTEGTDFTVSYQNAGFDNNITTQIAQNFASNRVALMCAIATPAATACYAAAEDLSIPVVFTAITDPVEAKLDSGNVTGTSDRLPVSAQLDLIRKLLPEAKTIGIIYTTSEPNSVSAIREYNEKAAEYGFTIEAIGVTAQMEVTQAVDSMIAKKVDCLSNLTDNNVVGVLASILEKTDEAGIPVFGSEIEQVRKGCVAAAGIDYYELGRQTGAMAAKILRGEKKASEIPYETISEYGIYINKETAVKLKITIPDEITAKAEAVSAAE